MIRQYHTSDAPALLALWNSAGIRAGYAPLDARQLDALLLQHPDFSPEYTFVLEDNGQLLGFVNGCTGSHIPKGDVRGYLSCLLLDERADTDANTQALLSPLEDAFRRAGRSFCAVTFFNPIRLPWLIPGTPGHQHNNAPGIATDLPLHGRMLALGYQQAAVECAMYLDLSQYRAPAWVEEKSAAMAAQGYTVRPYDPKLHTGLEDMLLALENPLWQQEISAAAQASQQVLVGLSGRTCAGFTGPIYPEETGRGYFTGIGVAPQYGRHGLGTLLFYRLLEQEQAAGAKYMSLFTGQTNPAKQIYSGAGFREVRTFGVMLKEL